MLSPLMVCGLVGFYTWKESRPKGNVECCLWSPTARHGDGPTAAGRHGQPGRRCRIPLCSGDSPKPGRTPAGDTTKSQVSGTGGVYDWYRGRFRQTAASSGGPTVGRRSRSPLRASPARAPTLSEVALASAAFDGDPLAGRPDLAAEDAAWCEQYPARRRRRRRPWRPGTRRRARLLTGTGRQMKPDDWLIAPGPRAGTQAVGSMTRYGRNARERNVLPSP